MSYTAWSNPDIGQSLKLATEAREIINRAEEAGASGATLDRLLARWRRRSANSNRVLDAHWGKIDA